MREGGSVENVEPVGNIVLVENTKSVNDRESVDHWGQWGHER